MNAPTKQARIAGLFYVLVALTAPIGLVYVPSKLFVLGDATATADHLRAAEPLLRLGIASELFHQTIEVFLVLALYSLFRSVNRPLARQLAILGLLPIPIVFLNVLNEIAALIIVGDPNFLAAFSKPQLDAWALFFIRLHGQGLQVAAIFWSLWLFPFGVLVLRSGFIPKVLGALLFLAGAGYLLGAIGTLILPRYADVLGGVASILQLGELPIIVWLLFWGARTPSSGPPPAAAPR